MPTDKEASRSTLPADKQDLIVEFVGLQKQQWAAIDRAVFVGMTKSEAREYERRAQRIVELQRFLGENLTYHAARHGPEVPSLLSPQAKKGDE